jgi:hypothetical protein
MSDFDLIGFLSSMVCLPPAPSAASVTAASVTAASAGSSHAMGTPVVTGHRRTSIHPTATTAKGAALAGTAAPRNIAATDAFPAAAATRAIASTGAFSGAPTTGTVGSAAGTIGLTTSATTRAIRSAPSGPGAIAGCSSTATRAIASSGTPLPPRSQLTLDLTRGGPVIRGASAML